MEVPFLVLLQWHEEEEKVFLELASLSKIEETKDELVEKLMIQSIISCG